MPKYDTSGSDEALELQAASWGNLGRALATSDDPADQEAREGALAARAEVQDEQRRRA